RGPEEALTDPANGHSFRLLHAGARSLGTVSCGHCGPGEKSPTGKHLPRGPPRGHWRSSMSALKVLAVAVAGFALAAGVAAQSSGVPSIVVDAHSLAHANLMQARAANAPFAFQEDVVIPSSDGLVMTNLGH